jgi:SAM-dependent methyltransferase
MTVTCMKKNMALLLNLFLNLFRPNFIEAFSLKYFIKTYSDEVSGNCLDVGCGAMPYKQFFDHCESYVGLEYQSEIAKKSFSPDFFYDGVTFPFESDSFDSLVSFEVMEHVDDIEVFFSEIVRVLKPGGKMIVSVPFCWMEHEKPHDYRRYTKIGLERYLEKKGFEVELSRKTTGALYSTLANFVIVLRSKLRGIFSYLADILILPLTLALHIVGFIEWLLESDDDSYTSTIVLAKFIGVP